MKLSQDAMRSFYQEVHREAIARNADDLEPVIHPGASGALNRFENFAHRLGMKRVLGFLRRKRGTLARARVLDLGCGRGRWVKAYAAEGAHVTGVDVSPDAVELLRRQLSGHVFLCQDLAAMEVQPETFDVVNSVTVLQHLPPESQAEALARAARSLRPGGYFALSENTSDFDAAWVFPHTRCEWVKMVESTGLQLCAVWGSNFDVLQRLARWALGATGLHRTASMEEVLHHNEPSHSPVRLRFQAALSFLSYPIELLCSWIPLVTPTHSVFVFQKPAEKETRGNPVPAPGAAR